MVCAHFSDFRYMEFWNFRISTLQAYNLKTKRQVKVKRRQWKITFWSFAHRPWMCEENQNVTLFCFVFLCFQSLNNQSDLIFRVSRNHQVKLDRSQTPFDGRQTLNWSIWSVVHQSEKQQKGQEQQYKCQQHSYNLWGCV